MGGKRYGWLQGSGADGWLGLNGGGGLGMTGIQYGWPSGQTEEPNVVMQVLFDEASGNIVDEVVGHTFTKTLGGADDFTYGVEPGGLYVNIEPGISVVQTNSVSDNFKSTTVPASMNFGATDDGVYEAWVKFNASQLSPVPYICGHGAFQEGGATLFYIYHQYATPQMLVRFRTDDASNTQITFSCADLRDDAFHKHRITFDRSGNIEYELDGTSLGTGSMSATNNKVLTMGSMRFFCGFNGSNGMNGTALEHRLTIGNLTNDSGFE